RHFEGRRLRLELLEDRSVPSFVTAPTFATGVSSSTGRSPFAVAVGDFTSDGKIDVVTANQGSDDISLLRGNGNGTFQIPLNLHVGGDPRGVTVAAINDDGKLDIITANHQDNTVTVLRSNGNGTFQPAV